MKFDFMNVVRVLIGIVWGIFISYIFNQVGSSREADIYTIHDAIMFLLILVCFGFLSTATCVLFFKEDKEVDV